MRTKTIRLLSLPVILIALIILIHTPPARGDQPTGPVEETDARPNQTTASGDGIRPALTTIDLADYGHRALAVAALTAQMGTGQGRESDPANPYAVIRQASVAFAAPETRVTYAVTLRNFDSVTQTVKLTNTLPAGLQYVADGRDTLHYDRATRTLTWQGELTPGRLDYVLTPAPVALPYLDLADFGVPALCGPPDSETDGESDVLPLPTCAETAVTFNLGHNSDTATLYGQMVRRLTVHGSGVISVDSAATTPPLLNNRWLPDGGSDAMLLAGLWHAVAPDARQGRLHVAIINGLIADHAVFYAQWHDVPHAADANITTRHATALVLGAPDVLDDGVTGRVFYIYGGVSDATALSRHGYTIGINGPAGRRGLTYAYAPCCGDPRPPQGFPPAAGTTFQLQPVLHAVDDAYHTTIHYAARVTGSVPQTIANTAVATFGIDSAPVWSTHYLAVRYQLYLPAVQVHNVEPAP